MIRSIHDVGCKPGDSFNSPAALRRGAGEGRVQPAPIETGPPESGLKAGGPKPRPQRQAGAAQGHGQNPKVSSRDRGWIQQELNNKRRGKENRVNPGPKRTSIRNPPGKDLAHERGREAAKGYDYSHAHLQDRATHRTQHKLDDHGRGNKERPIKGK